MTRDTSNSICPRCRSEILPDAPGGLCPKCLLEFVALSTHTGESSNPPAAPSIEAIRKAFPQLEIVAWIGGGGMGAVYQAKQIKLDRSVALKILPTRLANESNFAERFEKEGKMLARLNHPNIVGIYDFGQSDGFYYLMMEFVDGVNLRQAYATERFSPAQALSIIPKICEALQYAHDEGVLHRDIKPENILLDAKGRVKIADFGIAKFAGLDESTGLTATGARLGTPHYMAPEQVEQPANVDHRADIFSLGVVFYEMLTGELPLGRFAPPSERSPVDTRIDQVVLRALEKDRERRQQSADEVRTQIEWANTPSETQPAAVAEIPISNSKPWPPTQASSRAIAAVALVMAMASFVYPFTQPRLADRQILFVMVWLGIPAIAIGLVQWIRARKSGDRLAMFLSMLAACLWPAAIAAFALIAVAMEGMLKFFPEMPTSMTAVWACFWCLIGIVASIVGMRWIYRRSSEGLVKPTTPPLRTRSLSPWRIGFWVWLAAWVGMAWLVTQVDLNRRDRNEVLWGIAQDDLPVDFHITDARAIGNVVELDITIDSTARIGIRFELSGATLFPTAANEATRDYSNYCLFAGEHSPKVYRAREADREKVAFAMPDAETATACAARILRKDKRFTVRPGQPTLLFQTNSTHGGEYVAYVYLAIHGLPLHSDAKPSVSDSIPLESNE